MELPANNASSYARVSTGGLSSDKDRRAAPRNPLCQ